MAEIIRITTRPQNFSETEPRATRTSLWKGLLARVSRLEARALALPSDKEAEAVASQQLEAIEAKPEMNPLDLTDEAFEAYIADMERDIDEAAIPYPLGFVDREPVIQEGFRQTQAAIDEAYHAISETTADLLAVAELDADGRNVTVVDFARAAEERGIDPGNALRAVIDPRPQS